MAFEIDIAEPALADAEEYMRFTRDIKGSASVDTFSELSLEAALLAGTPRFPSLRCFEVLIHQLSGLRQEFLNFLARMSLQRIQQMEIAFNCLRIGAYPACGMDNDT